MSVDPGARAGELFASGCNCAQAVLLAVLPELQGGPGLDRETALRIATGFGGGMGRLQLTCGVLTGSIMLLGLKHGMSDPADGQAKSLCAERVRELVAGFEARHGSSECRALLGFDLSAPANMGRAHGICRPFVEEGARAAAAMVRGA